MHTEMRKPTHIMLKPTVKRRLGVIAANADARPCAVLEVLILTADPEQIATLLAKETFAS